MHITFSLSDKEFARLSDLSVERLRDCVQVLEAFSLSTEDEFLYIGTKLRGFYDAAVRISDLAACTLTLMSGEEISGTIRGLNILMEKVPVYLRQTETEIETCTAQLDQIVENIRGIHERLDELARITRNLRVHGFSTNIQNAALRNPDTGLSQLGEDVGRLSEIITAKSREIRQGTASLMQTIQGALTHIGKLGEGQETRAADIMKTSLSSIFSLTEKYRASSEAGQEITEYSGRILGSISTVVTSLQLHDITRQQFEGSRAAFHAMLNDLEQKRGESLPDAPSDLDAEKLLSLLRFSRSAAKPVEATRDDFLSAVNAVIGNLNSIAADVRSMLTEVRQISGDDADSSGSFLDTIGSSLASVSASVTAFSEGASARNALKGAIAQVVTTTHEMAGLVSEIEEIGDDIGLLAFNAAAKSGRIGEDGKALTVIAGSVQRVSSDARSQTASVSGMFASISSSGDALSSDLAASVQRSEAAIREMSEDLNRLVASLHEVNRRIGDMMQEINETGISLSREIEEVVRTISVHTSVDLLTEKLLANLSAIGTDVTGAVPDLVTREDLQADAASTSHDTGEPGETRPGEFGNNVELF